MPCDSAPRLLDQKRDLTLAAMGPATARALNQAGYRVAVQPAASRFDSESLLLHPRLERAGGPPNLDHQGHATAGTFSSRNSRGAARPW